MKKYVVEGGNPLFGEVHISGAKNAAVAIIPAALMVNGVCRIENIPQISDVSLLLSILQDLGANVRSINLNTVEIDCSHVHNARVPYDSARRCRASYYLIGSLLGSEYQVRNLRILLAGLEAGLPAATLRERMRESYV